MTAPRAGVGAGALGRQARCGSPQPGVLGPRCWLLTRQRTRGDIQAGARDVAGSDREGGRRPRVGKTTMSLLHLGVHPGVDLARYHYCATCFTSSIVRKFTGTVNKHGPSIGVPKRGQSSARGSLRSRLASPGAFFDEERLTHSRVGGPALGRWAGFSCAFPWGPRGQEPVLAVPPCADGEASPVIAVPAPTRQPQPIAD
jgi:hypothetical protein